MGRSQIPSAGPPRESWMPLAVPLLVLVNFAAFGIVVLVLFTRGPDPVVRLFADFGLVPSHLRVYAPLTYSLLHENALHVSLNMGLLWVFGAPVEEAVGRVRFAFAYFTAAILTGLLQAGMALAAGGTERDLPVLGASGAVSALAGIFAVRFYRSRVKLVWISSWTVPAIGLLGCLLLAEMGFAAWHAVQGDAALSAHWAHIGGFLLGLLYGQWSRLHRAGQADYLSHDAARAIEHGTPLSAVRRLETLRSVRPNDPAVAGELARAWALAGDREQCGPLYEEAIRGFLQAGNKRDAVTKRLELLELLPGWLLSDDDEFAVSCAMEEQGRGEDAVSAYRRFLASFPESPHAEMAGLRLGVALLRRAKRPAEARAALQAFLQKYPASAHRDYARSVLREADGE